MSVRPVWSESSLSAWRKLGSLATHWAHSEDSDQTGRMPRLIWVFAGRTLILLVLSCRGSFHFVQQISRRFKVCLSGWYQIDSLKWNTFLFLIFAEFLQSFKKSGLMTLQNYFNSCRVEFNNPKGRLNMGATGPQLMLYPNCGESQAITESRGF